MRILIIGGGTAGHMALAHLSKHWPDAELLHVFDNSRPTIGVGEGTTPDFVQWLSSIGITVDELRTHCQATPKRGLRFEGWGKHSSVFEHEFLPRSQQAVHFSAARLPALLTQRSQFQHIDDSVREITDSDDGTFVITQSGKRIAADLVIDARGFAGDARGSDNAPSNLQFDWIPTNSALVTKIPDVIDLDTTRAIARPLGWVFCIPLANETSFGYVFNSDLNTPDEVSNDFHKFLAEQPLSIQRTADACSFRQLQFPNFVRRDIFDGRVLHIGNRASFLEPLEATAIGVITLQLQLLLHWRDLLTKGMPETVATERINRIHEDTLVKVSIFIAWHYAAGSTFDTPFWQTAADRYRRLSQMPAMKNHFQQFAKMLEEAQDVSVSMLNTQSNVEESSRNQFGGYGAASFAQMASGLGLNRPRHGPDLSIKPPHSSQNAPSSLQ